MADEPNKSNKPVNGKVPKHLRDVFEQRDYNVSYEHLSTKEGMPKLSQRLEALEDLKGMTAGGSSERQQIVENIGFTEADMAEEIDRLEKIYGPKYNESLASSIETFSKYRNVNSRTTTMSGQQRFGRMAQNHRDRYLPTEMLENRNQALMEQASQIGGNLAGMARELGPDDDTSALGAGASKIGAIQEEIAFNKRLMKTQARQGLSTEKLINRGEDLDMAVSDFLQKKGIESKVDSGNVRSYGEEVKVMGHMRANRNKLQEDYNDAIENGSEMASVFAEKLKKANDALDTQTRVVKRMSDKGMDKGGGGFDRFSAAIQGMAFVGGAVANVAGNVNNIAGNQDITQMNNRAAFAAMGNQIYGKAEAAVFNNDVDAALEVVGSDKFAQAYADRNRKIAHGTGWTAAAGRAFSNIGGGILKGAGLGAGVGSMFAGIGAIPGAIGGGIIGGISGISDTVSEMSNLGYGNVGADASIRSYQAAKNLSAQERKIRASNMQAFYNQGLGIYNRAQGLGNRNAYAAGSNLMDQGYLGQLAELGISATQAQNLLPTLGQAGAFNFENEALPAMMSAGRASRAGTMSREGYMSTFARMRAMGGSDDDLQKIITAGFENAKNINQMVDASMQMSTNLANLGVSGVGSTSDMLSASAQMLKNVGVDPNLAIGMAANNMNNYNKQITDSGFNLGNIVERQQLRMNPNFSGASIFQLNQLSQMSAQEHKVFRDAQGGDEEALKQARLLARNKGITGMMFDAEGNVKSGAVNALGGSALTGALLNVGSAGINKDIVKRLQGGESLTDEQRAVLANAGFTEETAIAALGTKDTSRIPKDLQFDLPLNGQKRDQVAADRERLKISAGEKAAKELDPTKKAFENMENLMNTVSEMASPEKFGEVVGKAAEDFRVPVGEFGDHVKTMGTMLDNVVQQQNMMLKMMGENRGKDYTSGLFSKEKE